MAESSNPKEQLAFLNLGEKEVALLAELEPVLEEHADAFVAAFYRHLLAFGPTRELLRDPATKERLLVAQRDYLLSLARPALDDAYVAERRRIGETHERIGLAPRWYLGAYSLYFSLLTPLVYEAFPQDPARVPEILAALQKLLTFDSELAIDAYIERRERDLAYLTGELEAEGRRLDRDYREQSVELQRTIERAKSAEQLAAIGTLVAGLAHEIGTPMGVIQGHAKLLGPAIQGEDAEWRLRTIQEQIARISKIIQTLLNMARPHKTRRVPVDLERLIVSSLAFVQEKLSERNIWVESAFEPTPNISGDPERLQQLFLNLFLNAADAMSDGGELRVTLDIANGTDVEVRVGDSGVGIAERDLPHVFDPFFTSKTAGEGNGLGLMVASNIVTDHGGEIEATSAVGEGTEFLIRFPTGSDEPAEPATST
jgi:signal transduction histidine kinase